MKKPTFNNQLAIKNSILVLCQKHNIMIRYQGGMVVEDSLLYPGEKEQVEITATEFMRNCSLPAITVDKDKEIHYLTIKPTRNSRSLSYSTILSKIQDFILTIK
jgi:transposase